MPSRHLSSRTQCILLRGALALILALVSRPSLAVWAAATAIPNSSAIGFGGVYTPGVALSSDHSAIVAWRRTYDVLLATRAGQTGSWAVSRLSQDTGGGAPAVAMNAAGDTVVAWTGFGQVKASYRPAGGAWGTVATFEVNGSTTGITSDAMVSMNTAGDVIVGWVALNSGATAYEVHTVVRPKAGPWPAAGAFEVAGSDTWFSPVAVALDDDGRAAAAWMMTYAVRQDDPQSRAFVVRGAARPPSGPWGSAVDLSERSAVTATVTCDANVPAVVTASNPWFTVDPKTGDLALAYVRDGDLWVWAEVDGVLQCSGTENQTVRLATGSVANLPTGGVDYGTAVTLAPRASVRGGHLAVGWGEATTVEMAVGAFGSSLSTSQISSQERSTFGVGMGGQSRALAVTSLSSLNTKLSEGSSVVIGGVGDGPTLQRTNTTAGAVAASCESYGLAAMVGTDGKIYVSEYPAEGPWCPLALGGSFESGNFDGWLVFP